MGGIWLHHDTTQPALLWPCPFSTAIQTNLVTADNWTGTINNSELKLLGAISHQDILMQSVPIAESSHALLNDNMAAIHWLHHRSTTSTTASAYLLWLQALHQHHHHYFMSYDHIPGYHNSMANDCSCLWHLDDPSFLTHFTSHYPQVGGWQLCHLSSAMNPALTSALLQQQPVPESFLLRPMQLINTGPSGLTSVPILAWTPSSWTLPLTQSSSSVYLPSTITQDALPPRDAQSKLAQWKTPSTQWARCWPFCRPQTLGSTTWVPSIFA